MKEIKWAYGIKMIGATLFYDNVFLLVDIVSEIWKVCLCVISYCFCINCSKLPQYQGQSFKDGEYISTLNYEYEQSSIHVISNRFSGYECSGYHFSWP